MTQFLLLFNDLFQYHFSLTRYKTLFFSTSNLQIVLHENDRGGVTHLGVSTELRGSMKKNKTESAKSGIQFTIDSYT
jgi:hypothetical protein